MSNQIYNKRKVCDMVIKHGVDLSAVLNCIPYVLEDPYSRGGLSCLGLLYSSGPRSFVHDIAYQHVGLEEYWSMTLVNSWILRTIARADSRFCAKLRSEERTLRYSWGELLLKNTHQGLDFSIETQLMEMEQSSLDERYIYLIAVCAGGAAFELDTLLAYPQEIPELDVNKDNGMRSRRYLEVSAACGNIETFSRLLDAGVNVYSHQQKIWNHICEISMLSIHFQTSCNSYEIRTQMIKRLLANVSATLSAALIPMIVAPEWTGMTSLWYLNEYNQTEPGISRQIPTNTSSDPLKNGALVAAAAIGENVPALKLLIHHGSDLEWEDENGFTPLMIAITGGSSEVIKILIDAGADLKHSKACGFSVCELVRRIVLHVRSHIHLNSDCAVSCLPEMGFMEGRALFLNYGFGNGFGNGFFGQDYKRHLLTVLKDPGTLSSLGFNYPEIQDLLSQDDVPKSSKSKL